MAGVPGGLFSKRLVVMSWFLPTLTGFCVRRLISATHRIERGEADIAGPFGRELWQRVLSDPRHRVYPFQKDGKYGRISFDPWQ